MFNVTLAICIPSLILPKCYITHLSFICKDFHGSPYTLCFYSIRKAIRAEKVHIKQTTLVKSREDIGFSYEEVKARLRVIWPLFSQGKLCAYQAVAFVLVFTALNDPIHRIGAYLQVTISSVQAFRQRASPFIILKEHKTMKTAGSLQWRPRDGTLRILEVFLKTYCQAHSTHLFHNPNTLLPLRSKDIRLQNIHPLINMTKLRKLQIREIQVRNATMVPSWTLHGGTSAQMVQTTYLGPSRPIIAEAPLKFEEYLASFSLIFEDIYYDVTDACVETFVEIDSD